jgi:hypothetical protein
VHVSAFSIRKCALTNLQKGPKRNEAKKCRKEVIAHAVLRYLHDPQLPGSQTLRVEAERKNLGIGGRGAVRGLSIYFDAVAIHTERLS